MDTTPTLSQTDRLAKLNLLLKMFPIEPFKLQDFQNSVPMHRIVMVDNPAYGNHSIDFRALPTGILVTMYENGDKTLDCWIGYNGTPSIDERHYKMSSTPLSAYLLETAMTYLK
jgi:hypothetical protein